ncbi:hypothetical protein EWM64_g4503, partial [Hericium alpestre]
EGFYMEEDEHGLDEHMQEALLAGLEADPDTDQETTFPMHVGQGQLDMPPRSASTMEGSFAATSFRQASDGALEDDIKLQAEQIWRECQSERVKVQKEAEAALTVPRREGAADNSPLVGNLLGENHVNNVLMCNMLMGIQISLEVSSEDQMATCG